MPEQPVGVRIEEIDSFTVTRGVNVAPITFTSAHYYGSTTYGGDQMDMRFAKLDLGEAADAWLFNGDVFFNGIGSHNRVTFSPNAIFRDDVFIYGTLFADQLQFNFANVGNLTVGNNLRVGGRGEFEDGLAVGEDSLSELQSKQVTQLNLKLYVKGDIQAQSLIAESESSTQNELGDIYLRSKLLGPNKFARIGGTIGSTTDPFGIHMVGDSSFRDVTLDYKDTGGEEGIVNWIVRGDMNISRGFIATYLAAGDITEINTNYALDISGRGRVQGTLEVENLSFIGADAPEGNTDILTPSNVVVIDRGSGAAHNNENILRNKRFTVTERVYLNNNNKLGYTVPPTSTDERKDYYEAMNAGTDAWFGHDTMTFREDEFDALVGTSGTEIVVDDLIDPTYQRLKFNRIIIATIGTLHVEWTGYAYDPERPITDQPPVYNVDQDAVIQSYYFESPYFRNRDGGSVINWMPGDGRFGDENLIVQVEGDIIDIHATYPNMYRVNTAVALYIPKDSWLGYGATAADYTSLLSDYRTFIEWYPVENVSVNLNAVDWTNQTLCGGGFQPYSEWKLGLYPRLKKQTRLPFDTSAGSNAERMYQGEWDMDLVIYPTAIGRCSNLIGELYVSYMQS